MKPETIKQFADYLWVDELVINNALIINEKRDNVLDAIAEILFKEGG